MTDVQQYAWSPAEAAKKAGCSRKYIYLVMQRGELPNFHMGRSRKILDSALREWIESLATEQAS